MKKYAQNADTPSSPKFKSRPGALAWSFRKSRDKWKKKHHEGKKENKRLKVKTHDLEKSRAEWRAKYEALQVKNRQLEEEKKHLEEQLQQQQAEFETQKKTNH